MESSVDSRVELSHEDDIAVVTIRNPPVNALSPGVPEAIRDAILAAANEPGVHAIVAIGDGSTFIAGADINEFVRIAAGETMRIDLAGIVRAIEDCPKPVVMALHGTAFGGGLEVAMGGHYRVIAASGQVGQPEVKIGLIPGGSGTQRLPRLTGMKAALEMCAFGEPAGAAQAVALGIADRLIEGDLLTGAVGFAREIAAHPIRKTRERDDRLAPLEPALFDAAAERVRKARKGLAGLSAIAAVRAAQSVPFDEGCAIEKRLFTECLPSPEAKALLHAFFGERTVAKIPGIPKDTKTFEIRSAAVIGAGTMGAGIAMVYANAGIPVILKETTQAALDRGMEMVRANYAGSVRKGRLTQAAMDERMALISPRLDYAGFDTVDIAIEAVFENMALKKEIFGALDAIVKPDCILATNTSTLDIDEIASATSRPAMVVGHHFFSPANVMRLLEVVRGKATSAEVIATSMALAKKLKKVAVLSGNSRGFIGNRMMDAYLREAQFLVEEGASVEDVNGALYDFGMAMGPLAMADLIGLDVLWRMDDEARHLRDPARRQPLVADQLYAMGRYGQKTGRGWSRYDETRRPLPDPEVAELIERTARAAGIARREIGRQEIVERCTGALANEGAKLLEEGVALRAVDIDMVYLHGYGFPAWRGGPMFQRFIH